MFMDMRVAIGENTLLAFKFRSSSLEKVWIHLFSFGHVLNSIYSSLATSLGELGDKIGWACGCLFHLVNIYICQGNHSSSGSSLYTRTDLILLSFSLSTSLSLSTSSIFLFLSISPPHSLLISRLSPPVSISLSLYYCFSISLSLYFSVSLFLSVYISLSPPVSLSPSLSHTPSLSLHLYLTLHLLLFLSLIQCDTYYKWNNHGDGHVLIYF